MSDRHRIDHWLKLVCIFKHRTEATEACKGGLVKVNGQRVKPAFDLKEGDTVEYLKGDIYHRVSVVSLPEKQPSKEEARTMYVDHTPPQERDPVRIALRERGAGRPTKKERREIERIKKR